MESEFIIKTSGLPAESTDSFLSLTEQERAVILDKADTFAVNASDDDTRYTTVEAMQVAGKMYSQLSPEAKASIPFHVFANSIFGSSVDKVDELNEWIKENKENKNVTIETINSKL